MSQLPTRYDAACRAVADAKSVDEVKELHDKADAMRVYAHQAKNRQLEIDAAEIRMRAERRLGEMIVAQKQTVGLATGGDAMKARFRPGTEVRPTLSDAGIDKKLSSRAQKMAAVPEEKFEGMLGEWRERLQKENERVTTNLLRAGEQEERTAMRTQAVAFNAAALGKFAVLYADPPWRYENPPMGGSNRSIENHYPTMTLEEICALPVEEIANENSILFLWATAPKLAECFSVITAWGFTYRTNMVWVKDHIGMGYHARNRHELLLIAKRGELPPPAVGDRPDSVFQSKRGEHSAKPREYYALIEHMYPSLPRIELFCRGRAAPGWEVWGNEAEAA